MRDLPFELHVPHADRRRAVLDLSPWVTAQSGAAGAIAVVADLAACSLCASLIAPDWMATSNLSMRLGRLPSAGEVVVEASALRVGRTSVTIDVVVSNSIDQSRLGEFIVTFTRLERRESNLDLSGADQSVGRSIVFDAAADPAATSVDAVGLVEAIGAIVVDPSSGALEVPITDYLRNSFGAANGGVVVAIAERAAREGAASALGVAAEAAQCTDASVHFLGQGRVGPLSTTVRVLDRTDTDVSIRVDVDDGGANRRVAVAHVGVRIGNRWV